MLVDAIRAFFLCTSEGVGGLLGQRLAAFSSARLIRLVKKGPDQLVSHQGILGGLGNPAYNSR